jgi:hypothetical protein
MKLRAFSPYFSEKVVLTMGSTLKGRKINGGNSMIKSSKDLELG